jgi:hypothetical protein
MLDDEFYIDSRIITKALISPVPRFIKMFVDKRWCDIYIAAKDFIIPRFV